MKREQQMKVRGVCRNAYVFKRQGGYVNMIEKEIVVKLKDGLQARPAALFVQEANRYHSHITLEKADKVVNVKSIMGIMGLAIGHGERITLKAEGSDAEQALEALKAFVENENM